MKLGTLKERELATIIVRDIQEDRPEHPYLEWRNKKIELVTNLLKEYCLMKKEDENA